MKIKQIISESIQLNEFDAGGNFKPPKTPKGKGRGPWDDDDRSKIVLAVGQLLDGGNKVDWLVPGQMGHVVGTRDEGVSLKRLNKPHSKITYFLPISSDARDHRYQIKMKGPKHYVVVGADDDDPLEEGETWAKHNNPRAGGMSKKSVNSYRRSHPGSKIQTAVTTKPSKLKKGSKAAKRRKSFCARMRGMKKHRTGAKTARDPNSNINKSLRRCNCESVEDMRELVMIAEQFIAKHKK